MQTTMTPVVATATDRSAAARHRAGWITAFRLSVLVAGLMALQSAVGVLVPSLYRDVGWVTAAWYGNDLVTLFVAVPLLAWALAAARRGSPRAELLWYSMLGYAVYNYAYYLFGAVINWFFPVYAALFVLPVFVLILGLGSIDARTVAGRFAPTTPVRWIAGYMLFTGIGLAIAWTAQWAMLLAAGVEPTIGAEAFQLVAAMDMTFMVPWFVVGAVLLLRRAPWGYIVAPIIIMKGATYTLVLSATSTVAVLRGVEGTAEQIPIWVAWTAVGGIAAWALLRNLRATDESREVVSRARH
jgi:hypothetical protein